MSTNEILRPFFNPQGVVVVGARSTPGFGYTMPISLINRGWGERMYLYNPKGGELHGKQVYKSLSNLPDAVDLAVVIVPAQGVPGVMKEIGLRGIRNVILESAGFVEIGEKGRALHEEVYEIIREFGIRLIGPNCLGVVNTDNCFHTVSVIDEAFKPGPVSIIAQSGMFGSGLLDFAYQRRLFFSKVVTLGNRMDVNECEVLDYLHRDPATGVIMMYLEGASDGPLLVETLARVTQDKPVLILKSGRTPIGRKATASHTGSMSGEDEIYDAAFAQGGAVRAETVDELLYMARVFSTQPLPKGGRLGIITTSGSMGVMSTDTAISLGLTMPAPSARTIEKVMEDSPEWMNVKNPLDVGPSRQFAIALDAMLEDPEIDMVLASIVIPFSFIRLIKKQGLPISDWVGDIGGIRSSKPEKPFVLCSIGNSEFLDDLSEISSDSTPVFFSPELAVKALSALWEYRRRQIGMENNGL